MLNEISELRPLTNRQQQVFDLIKDKISDTGMPPTRAEIAKFFGFKSANAAEEHLKALAKKGYIEMLPGTSRGIRLTEKLMEEAGLPLIGRVAAGEPILAAEHVEDHYKVDGNLFHPAADYLLRVNGESMKNIGILDGDLLAVHQTTDVQNGQVIVARVEENVTVKRYKREGNIVYLHAENDDFSPIKVDLSDQEFNIEGLAVGVIRSADWM
ncbi:MULTISPECIES: transcriptional repressor LexA [unclassified Colwellia]|jgi:repressor LexA|uniref:transcriptional repressor LexA n=1 Tax=unclassified Colwellia TaxID=196834 RepID=UPI0015F673DB|nr:MULTISPECIES: transcriptional repressor LexA [unclassified Colwellia]MBA6365085.1 repressor LexA [Colwellia sp. BRX8-8]MBA6231102.1 repressor LexA [Colwellia sp. MB02u-7]MBA6235130.1 repressor LexA [Colwellia sp. MB02u-11]MBA6252996.1 repressor LexA [Colwellia sp. MB3u-55]MBA6257483.1 repressor LexA [Colwellia sp. MB3u-28]|tara:strand:- start:3028 stop:3663 length:636 start_codon:yes stop_codon:yes gene_type:complete